MLRNSSHTRRNLSPLPPNKHIQYYTREEKNAQGISLSNVKENSNFDCDAIVKIRRQQTLFIAGLAVQTGQ